MAVTKLVLFYIGLEQLHLCLEHLVLEFFLPDCHFSFWKFFRQYIYAAYQKLLVMTLPVIVKMV